MLAVFAENNSPRLEYILKHFFNDLLKTEWKLLTNPREFENHAGPKLNYSHRTFNNAIVMVPQGILSEDTIRPQETDVFNYEKTKAFFKTTTGSLPNFDVFGASFYLLSRYEEYLPFEPDRHGRFLAENSLAGKHHFLQQPVINLWALSLKQILKAAFSEIAFGSTNYQFTPTIDVDNVYAYMGKGFFRSAGAYLKSVLKGDFRTIAQRTRALSGAEPDPFDHYSRQEQLVKKYGLRLIYFLLLGSGSDFDHNVSPRSKKYQALMKKLSGFADLGIHPSYKSNSNATAITIEKKQLEKQTSQKITRSRQHFLKMSLPLTYSSLIESGIEEDYSMGYASAPGFRAGTCIPFRFFDLRQNKETPLRIMPFTLMDVTFSDYLKMPPPQAMNTINELILEVKQVNGLFIPVWHDRSFSDTHYPGWGQAFEEMIQLAARK